MILHILQVLLFSKIVHFILEISVTCIVKICRCWTPCCGLYCGQYKESRWWCFGPSCYRWLRWLERLTSVSRAVSSSSKIYLPSCLSVTNLHCPLLKTRLVQNKICKYALRRPCFCIIKMSHDMRFPTM